MLVFSSAQTTCSSGRSCSPCQRPRHRSRTSPAVCSDVQVAREDPTPVRPGLQRVLAQSAPDRRDRDRLGDDPGDREPGDLRDRQASQRQADLGGSRAVEVLDLDDHPMGKRTAAGHSGDDREGPPHNPRSTVCASGSRSSGLARPTSATLPTMTHTPWRRASGSAFSQGRDHACTIARTVQPIRAMQPRTDLWEGERCQAEHRRYHLSPRL